MKKYDRLMIFYCVSFIIYFFMEFVEYRAKKQTYSPDGKQLRRPWTPSTQEASLVGCRCN